MSLTISQMVASSYPGVLAIKNQPENQWAESSFMRTLDRLGGIVKKSVGPTIECPFDWRRNAAAEILGATELAALTLTTKTDIIGTASYAVAQLRVPGIWSKGDETKNDTEVQKIDLVESILNNAFESHDDLVEATLFTTSAVGGDELLGLDTLVTTDGLGTIGGINASTETFWRNKVDGFTNGDDMEAGMESLWVRCEKGSGSKLSPNFLVSDGATQALFVSTQQGQQRYVDTQDLKASFKTVAFKTANYVYSRFGGSNVYFGNTRSLQLVVAKNAWKKKGATMEQQASEGYVFKIYSACQFVTNNRSRLGVLVQS